LVLFRFGGSSRFRRTIWWSVLQNNRRLAVPARRFPPPWTVEDIDAAFVVKDSAGQGLAYVYYEDEPQRRVAAKAADLGDLIPSRQTRPSGRRRDVFL
jgi:hypothetical protein